MYLFSLWVYLIGKVNGNIEEDNAIICLKCYYAQNSGRKMLKKSGGGRLFCRYDVSFLKI